MVLDVIHYFDCIRFHAFIIILKFSDVNALEGLSRKLNERARDSNEQIQSSVELIRTTAQQMSLEVNRAVSRYC